MKNKILGNLKKRMDNIFDNDFEAPIRQLENEHVDKILKFLEYCYNISLKNVDVLIDLLKVFLSVSGSIFLAKYTVESFSIKSPYIEYVFIILIILLFILFKVRTKISNNAIDKYSAFLDMDSKRTKDSSKSYFRRLHNVLNTMKKEASFMMQKKKK